MVAEGVGFEPELRSTVGLQIIYCSSLPQTSNKIIQKRLAFPGDQSGTVVGSVRFKRSGILPRRLGCRSGASVVRRGAVLIRREIPMPKPVKRRARTPVMDPASASPAIATRPEQKGSDGEASSKQSRVIMMLKSADGTTIAAMMKATGWQQHSVRGFLAGVVRKKLKLKLNSNKVDGKRIYRVVGRTSSRAGGQQSRHHSP